jgi:Gram-negative bacterial TonB protein C-terminal
MFLHKLNRLMATLGFTLLTVSVTAQTSTWSEWETLRPEAEEFTVLMPKNSSSETEKFPYHKMELTARLYLSSLPKGPVLAVASFSGIKSNPAMYSDFQRFNSYVNAFKTWFPSKVRPKEVLVKLTQIGNNTFRGYAGREYRMSIGDLNGSVFAYATKKRFYTIISLNTKKDDALQEKFLSSFYLPDRPTEVTTANTEVNEPKLESPTNAVVDPKTAEATGTFPANTQPETPTEGNAQPNATAPNNQNNQTRDNAQQPQGRAPISGGVLNGKAIYLPLPDVPAGDAVGTVMVQVLVDEQGSVIAARPVSGPAQLQASAVLAARLARFSPTMLMGEPVKVSGTLVYNFVR